MPSPVRVLTARFEDLVAIGLRQLIDEEPNIELVADQVEIDELEDAIELHKPDLVVLNFGSLARPAQVFQLHQSRPETRLVVLANRPSAAECNQMISFGATACLAKEVEGRDVINALHLASRGMHVLPRSAAANASSNGFEPVMGSDVLTPREADVLELLQDGATNAQIAQTLMIGVETVRTHARNIYRKLGISSRRELARLS
ncbi:MAG TPA: response regulator transcription factor [Thermoleophilaceae bacterium]|jgi:DNA-binding NarL/FixJ family response regulator|nr:response regulator transcription factor [Thermoleophilaceae bacterium]